MGVGGGAGGGRGGRGDMTLDVCLRGGLSQKNYSLLSISQTFKLKNVIGCSSYRG